MFYNDAININRKHTHFFNCIAAIMQKKMFDDAISFISNYLNERSKSIELTVWKSKIQPKHRETSIFRNFTVIFSAIVEHMQKSPTPWYRHMFFFLLSQT